MGTSDEIAEADGIATDEPPNQPKQYQGQHGVTAPDMVSHGVAVFGSQPLNKHECDQRPVKQSGRQIPYLNGL